MVMPSQHATVVAVAGRRIDPSDAARGSFPAASVSAVAAAVKRFLVEHNAIAVVASAACGADIVALEAAEELGIPIRIILPFDGNRFRRTSVEDRGIAWGERFDAVLGYAAAHGDVITLVPPLGNDDAAFGEATRRVLIDAQTLGLAAGAPVSALAIWNGEPRPGVDATRDFLELARTQGLPRFSIASDPVLLRR